MERGSFYSSGGTGFQHGNKTSSVGERACFILFAISGISWTLESTSCVTQPGMVIALFVCIIGRFFSILSLQTMLPSNYRSRALGQLRREMYAMHSKLKMIAPGGISAKVRSDHPRALSEAWRHRCSLHLIVHHVRKESGKPNSQLR